MEWRKTITKLGTALVAKRGRGLRGMDMGAIKKQQHRQFGTELINNIVNDQSRRIAKKRTFEQFEEQKEEESAEAQPTKRRRYNLRTKALVAKLRGKENVSGQSQTAKRVTVRTAKVVEVERDSDEDIDLAPRRTVNAAKANRMERVQHRPPIQRSQCLENERRRDREQRSKREVAAAFVPVVAPKMLECDVVAAVDDLALPEYSTEIMAWLHRCEGSAFSRNLVRSDYLSSRFQPDINESMRRILIEWLFNVHRRFQLCDRTLYTAIYVLDAYLSLVPLKRDRLQLVGCAALWLSSKYHEIYAPESSDFVFVSNHSFSVEDLFAAEVDILVAIEFKFTDIVTPLHFLERYLQIAIHPLSEKYRARGTAKALKDGQRYISLVTELSNYFGHLALFDCNLLTNKPSLVAAAALCYTVLSIALYSRWPAFLEKHTGFSYADLKPLLHRLDAVRKVAVAGKRMTVLQKMHKSVAKWIVRLNTDAVLRNGRALRAANAN